MTKRRDRPTNLGAMLFTATGSGGVGWWFWGWAGAGFAVSAILALGVLELTAWVKYPPPAPPPAADPYAAETVAVYRLFNDVGALLYIGISDTPKRRFQEHKADKQWAEQIDNWTVEWYRDRPRAAAAELQAIVREVPAYNSAGMPTSNQQLTYWRQLFEAGHYPSAYNLGELFLLHRRMLSLREGAVRACDPDTVLEIYDYATKRASGFVMRSHKRFIKEWEAELHAARRRRQERERSRLPSVKRG